MIALPSKSTARTQRRMLTELHQHLADMAELRQQVEQALELCDPRSDGKLLFDELAVVLDDHHAQLSECLRELDEPATVA